jgi:hypothetical protein
VRFVGSADRVTSDDRAHSASRHADEGARPVGDYGAETGKAVAVKRDELCAEVVHDERPLSAAANTI